jgi:hypothetical protein
MTGSEANLLAIMFGLGVFAVILAIGWRSVQHRRIMRLQSGDGQETIIVADEDDEISSVETSREATQPAGELARSNVGASRSRSAADLRS